MSHIIYSWWITPEKNIIHWKGLSPVSNLGLNYFKTQKAPTKFVKPRLKCIDPFALCRAFTVIQKTILLFYKNQYKYVCFIFKVATLCKELILLIFEGRSKTTPENWKKFQKSLYPALPLLAACSTTITPLGRFLIRLFDVDSDFATFQIFGGNVRLLFSREVQVNEEAFARLCCLIAKEDKACLKLPKMRDIKGWVCDSLCIPFPRLGVEWMGGSHGCPGRLWDRFVWQV